MLYSYSFTVCAKSIEKNKESYHETMTTAGTSPADSLSDGYIDM